MALDALLIETGLLHRGGKVQERSLFDKWIDPGTIQAHHVSHGAGRRLGDGLALHRGVRGGLKGYVNTWVLLFELVDEVLQRIVASHLGCPPLRKTKVNCRSCAGCTWLKRYGSYGGYERSGKPPAHPLLALLSYITHIPLQWGSASTVDVRLRRVLSLAT